MGKKRREPKVTLGTRVILLFAMEHGERHGLGIQRFAERLGGREFPIWPLHAVLRQLERHGFVTSRRDKNPELGIYRRCYRITRTGTAALNEIRSIVEATKKGSMT